MTRYLVRFIHRVSPKDSDTMSPVELPDGAMSDRRTLGAALRKAGVLVAGTRLRDFRVTGNQVAAFPDRGIWHCVVLTPEDS